MSDGDITEQLRVAAPLARAHMDSTDLVGWPIRFILLEAADEIERLRAEVAAWKDVAQEITMYAAMQELKEAAGE